MSWLHCAHFEQTRQAMGHRATQFTVANCLQTCWNQCAFSFLKSCVCLSIRTTRGVQCQCYQGCCVILTLHLSDCVSVPILFTYQLCFVDVRQSFTPSHNNHNNIDWVSICSKHDRLVGGICSLNVVLQSCWQCRFSVLVEGHPQ